MAHGLESVEASSQKSFMPVFFSRRRVTDENNRICRKTENGCERWTQAREGWCGICLSQKTKNKTETEKQQRKVNSRAAEQMWDLLIHVAFSVTEYKTKSHKGHLGMHRSYPTGRSSGMISAQWAQYAWFSDTSFSGTSIPCNRNTLALFSRPSPRCAECM